MPPACILRKNTTAKGVESERSATQRSHGGNPSQTRRVDRIKIAENTLHHPQSRAKKLFTLLGQRLREKPGPLLSASVVAACRSILRPRKLPRVESLKAKLLLGSLALAAAILGVTYLMLSSKTQEMAAKQAQKHVGDVLNCFSDAIGESVAANDRLQVHILAQAFLNNGVQAILVTRSDGGTLYSSEPLLPAEKLFTRSDLHSVEDGGILGTSRLGGQDFLHAATAVHFGDTPVGVIHLWLNKMNLEDGIQSAHAYVYPIFSAGCLLLVLLGGAILCAPFRALKRLGLAAERIGAGDFSERVPVHGRDEVAGFCQVFNRMADKLELARQDIIRKQLETIEAMINVVEAKDVYTQGHCLRVGGYARRILDRYEGLSLEDVFLVETAAILHDIGKIGIPDDILLKEGRLSSEEVARVRDHVVIGEKILQHIHSMKDIPRWVRHHHERWDGSGYPDAIQGTSIPFASRVIAVADTIDALLTNRPYRKEFTMEMAIRVLEEERGRQFDPEIVDHAMACLREDADRATREKDDEWSPQEDLFESAESASDRFRMQFA